MKKISLILVLVSQFYLNGFSQCSIANAGSDQGGCSSSSYSIGTSAVAGYTYSWSPTTGLNNPNIAQPTASPSVTTTYTLTMTPTSPSNLLTNGDFESGFTGYGTDYPVFGNGYLTASSTGYYSISLWASQFSCITYPYAGTKMMVGEAPDAAASTYRFWHQTVNVSQSTSYTFSGMMSNINPYANGFDIKFIGNSTGTTTVSKSTSVGCNAWDTFNVQWNSSTNTSVTIEIRFNFDSYHNNVLALDNLAFAPCVVTHDNVTIYVGAPSISPTGPISECIQYETNQWLSLSTNLTNHIQWYENGTAISGATSSTLNLTNNPSGGAGYPNCSSTITVKNSLTNCTSSGVSVTRKNFYSPLAYVNQGGIYSTPSSYCASGGSIQQVPSGNSGTTYWWEVYDENWDPATDIIISPMNTTSPSASISFGSYPYTTAYIVPRASDNGCNFYMMDYEISIDLGCRQGIVTNTDSSRKSTVRDPMKRPFKKPIPKATNIKASVPFMYLPEKNEKQELGNQLQKPEMRVVAAEFVKLFPNPATNQIAVTSKNLIRHIQVSNLAGVVLRNFKVNGLSMAVINLQDLPVGIYNCRVVTGKGTEYLKLVVQR